MVAIGGSNTDVVGSNSVTVRGVKYCQSRGLNTVAIRGLLISVRGVKYCQSRRLYTITVRVKN